MSLRRAWRQKAVRSFLGPPNASAAAALTHSWHAVTSDQHINPSRSGYESAACLRSGSSTAAGRCKQLEACTPPAAAAAAGSSPNLNLRTFASSATAHAAAEASQRRKSEFNQLSAADIDRFKHILGPDAVITNQQQLAQYNRDWMRKYQGASQLALLPRTAEQVSQVLKHCSERRLALVPQGGNSGLAGGSVPVHDEVILSTAAMKKFVSFDEVSGIVVCQAGCTLQAVDDYVKQHGFMVPLDLGAKQECHIGGNVTSNAGGLRLLRYGSMRENVLGVQAVTPTGTVLDLLSTNRKDNTGYDLSQLFIGSEGTLGVVTAVSLLCPRIPAAVDTLCIACPDWPAVIQAYSAARSQLGEVLSAFEFLDDAILKLTLQRVADVHHPVPDNPMPFYVIVEAAGSDADSNRRRLAAFAKQCSQHGCSLSSSELRTDESDAGREAAAQGIWRLRKNLSEGLRLTGGPVFKYDLSLPPGEMYRLVEETRRRLAKHPDCTVVGYGHLGDGNLHLNVAAPKGSGASVLDAIEPFVYQYTAERGGSISAEHGLGQMKNKYMSFSKPPAAIDVMRQIKALFDPAGIMNPYKLLPPKESK